MLQVLIRRDLDIFEPCDTTILERPAAGLF